MAKDRQLWQFLSERLQHGRKAVLLVVAESSGSSPGRAGYKMAVADDGNLSGSIGGGLMEVNLVEFARAALRKSDPSAFPILKEQVHRKNAENASGMICSGRQTVLLSLVDQKDLAWIEQLCGGSEATLTVTSDGISLQPPDEDLADPAFVKTADGRFIYRESISRSSAMYIVGGGHCALALSELMSRLDFRITVLDDRPQLNTLEKNEFADKIIVVDDYKDVAEHIPPGRETYIAVMTIGYACDAVVIRTLAGHTFRYLGVLGSQAKMAALLKELRSEGVSPEYLQSIRTPIGIPINSRSPQEIAVSIAAEIISIRNS